jgi:hypothetical protein
VRWRAAGWQKQSADRLDFLDLQYFLDRWDFPDLGRWRSLWWWNFPDIQVSI